MENQNIMAVMPMKKLLFTMSLPLMLSLVIQSLYNIVDGIYVSRISENSLTATSLAYPVQFMMIAISVGTAVGLNALMSRYIGSGNPHKACVIATTGMILCLLEAMLFSLIGLLFSEQLASFFSNDPEIAALTQQYMKICVCFCFGIFLETLAQRMLTSVGLTTLSMISLIVGSVTNIILDPIFIFGYFSLPAMGIKGAAIATVIGQWVGAVVALLLNKFYNPAIHIIFKEYAFRFEDVISIYKIGMPTMIMQAIGSFMVGAVNSVLIVYSATAVAFFGAYYKLQNFVMMPMNGLGQAALPIAAFNYGSHNEKRIRELYGILVPSAVIIALLGLVVFELIPGTLLSLFHAGAEMLELGKPALRIIAITFPFAAYVIVNGYFCTGLGNSVINMISGALRQLIVLVPCLTLLVKALGIEYGWFAFWLAEGVAFLYSWLSVKKQLKRL